MRSTPPTVSLSDPRCSFCGRSWSDVFRLISGPGVFICDDCVSLAADALAQDVALTAAQKVRFARGRRADDEPVTEFLRAHLAGRPAETVSLSELLDVYLANLAN